MLSTAVVIADGLGDGFARAARAADLPDVIVRFDPQSLARVDAAGSGRFRTSPRSRPARSSPTSTSRPTATAADRRRPRWSAPAAAATRSSPDATSPRGLARWWSSAAWRRRGASRWAARSTSAGSVRCASSVSPRLPTTSATRSRSRGSTCPKRRSTPGSDADPNPQVNVAEIWLRNPRYLNEVLVQARTTSFGLRGLRFVTRSGVRVLLDQAAGIVIDLLVALSVFALATAGVMLAASARAEVQRRLTGDRDQPRGRRLPGSRRRGSRRSRRPRSRSQPRPLGLLRWACSPPSGPSDHLLTMLNEPPAGSGLIAPLAAGWAAVRLDPGARGRLAGVARRGTPAGRAARRAPGSRPVADLGAVGALGARPRAGAGGARRPPRRRAPGAPRRDRADARHLDRVRAAAARAGVRAQRARDRSRRRSASATS